MLFLCLLTINHQETKEPASPPLLAIAARFYNAPNDPRVSYHQIYLGDLHGKKWKQLTFGASERTNVRWVGRKKLAWIESSGETKIDNAGFHGSFDRACKLVEFDIASSRQRVVAKGFVSVVNNDRQSIYFPRGQAAFQVSKRPDSNEIDRSTVYFSVQNGRLQKVKQLPKTAGSDIFDTEVSSWRKDGIDVTQVEPTDEMFNYPSGNNGSGGASAVRIVYKRQPVLIQVPQPDYLWRANSPNHCWLRSSSISVSGGSDMWIYGVDLLSGKSAVVATDVLNVDFQGDGYWAASSNDKGLSHLGKLQVWTRDLWAGDTRTGRQWRVTSRVVHGTDAQVQPMK